MGRVGERAGEKHGYERYIDWLPLSRPQSGTWLAPQACALTGNQTCDPLVRKPGTQSTEPHQPGVALFLLFKNF